MDWKGMYEVALERVKQLNEDVSVLEKILRAYLPIIEEESNEKR